MKLGSGRPDADARGVVATSQFASPGDQRTERSPGSASSTFEQVSSGLDYTCRLLYGRRQRYTNKVDIE